MFKPYFTRFAAYNIWANGKLYDAASAVSEADLTRDVGAFFGSLSGTLNHMIVADRVWLRRFLGDGPEERQLNRVITHDLDELRGLRAVEDDRISGFITSRSEADFAASFSYRNIAGHRFTQPLSETLAHFFNHHTHHRGQAHGILTHLTGNAPELDLLYYIRELEG
ncbi:MAG: DinB family protein [Minwuia sp.]|nr:DinB family protein [Minwuia sp.]